MDIQAILVVLFCLVCIQHVELAISKCNKCPPGTFVLARCNKTAQTICEPCKDGTFSADSSYEEKCVLCKSAQCQPTMGLIRKCNGTVDNQCGCLKPNQFHHFSTDSCRVCPGCPPGEFPVRPCSGETICSRCRKNYFSNKTENYNTMCIKCTRCRIYETMCTTTQDAVCGKNVFTTAAVFTTPQRQAFVDGTPTVKTEKWPTTTDLQSKEKNKVDPIIIIVTLCTCVITVFIIVAVVLWRKKKETNCLRTRGFTIIEESRAKPSFSFGGS
ncbi:Tumor necrosis factor receptor superfamily member 16 [Paramuricea clavata]|uniref:Tumor necrosis factor receptor superfamily member 16 n=1 Tax=Paramuricea clavata TaxID=317549 RepID=A0A6S7GGR8_PARCT|nr:Tumor necrosis factor receptor superfamily member 16 [Paramuricea clavata]